MPAARYWRLVGIETYARGDLELSELHLYDGSGRADVGVNITSAFTPPAGTLANLQDADLGTTCRFTAAMVRAPGFSLVWDFGPGGTCDAVGVRLGAAASEARFIAALTLQYSTDGAAWLTYGVFNRYPYPGDSAFTAGAEYGDPYFTNAVLIARADGADGDTTFVDDSAFARTLTTRGGAKTSTTVTLFGKPMMYFDGTDDYAECASGVDFSLPGDFTFEAWVYPLLDDATDRWIFGNYSSSGLGGLAVGLNGGKPKVVKAGVSGLIVSDAIAAPKNNLHYIRVVKSDSTVTMTVNGAASGSYTGELDFVHSGTPRVTLGALANAADGSTATAGTFFAGYLAVRLTKGVARLGGVPEQGFPSSSGNLLLAPQLATRGVGTELFADSPLPSGTGTFFLSDTLVSYRDFEFGGVGVVSGTVKRDADPSDLPLKRRVRLHREQDGMLIREVWSNATTGAYSFPWINETWRYTVITYDYEHNYRAVIADNILPELMP